MKDIIDDYEAVDACGGMSLETLWYLTFDNDTSNTEWMDAVRVAMGKDPLSTGSKLDSSKRKSNAPLSNYSISRERVNGVLGYSAIISDGSKIWDEDFSSLQTKLGIDFLDDTNE